MKSLSAGMRFSCFLVKSIGFLALSLLAFPALSQTLQNQAILIADPSVGEVIDLEEKVKFGLFPSVDSGTFQIARFLLSTDSAIVLEVVKRNGKIDYLPYTRNEFELTSQLIQAKAKSSETGKAALASAPATAPPAAGAKMVYGQLTGTVYFVILANDMKFFATIAEKRANEYVFNTQFYGTITADFKSIKYLKEVENRLRNQSYWIPNPHDSRLYFGPTGRGIPKGEGYFQTIYGYINSVNYGVSDNFSIGATFLTVPFAPLEYNIFAFTPKISVPLSKKASIAGGVLYATLLGQQFGLLYGAGTIGNKNDHVSLGVGYGFVNSEISRTPVIMAGGVKRVSNRVALMTENYFVSVPDDQTFGFGLYGVRFIWPRTNLDVGGFYAAISATEFNKPVFTSSYFIPTYISFTFRFGNRKDIGKL